MVVIAPGHTGSGSGLIDELGELAVPVIQLLVVIDLVLVTQLSFDLADLVEPDYSNVDLTWILWILQRQLLVLNVVKVFE